MVSCEEFSRILSPLLHYLKKVELELTCPTCFNLLRKPTLLPCNHIFCSQCIGTEVNCQNNCLACGSSFSSGELKHAVHMQAIIDIFRGMDAAFSAIAQKLDSHVDISGMKAPLKDIQVSDHPTTEATKLFPNESPIFYSSQSEAHSQDSQVHMSGIKVPSIKCCASSCKNIKEKVQHRNADIPSLTEPLKEKPISNCIIGADEELQGSQFGEKVPQKGTPGSSNNTGETLQENLAFKRPDRKLTENVYTRRPRDDDKCGKLATFGSKNHAENEGNKTFINQWEWETPPRSYTTISEIDCIHQENDLVPSILLSSRRRIETKGKPISPEQLATLSESDIPLIRTRQLLTSKEETTTAISELAAVGSSRYLTDTMATIPRPEDRQLIPSPSIKRLSMDNYQNNDTKAITIRGIKLLTRTDPLTCEREYSEKSNHDISGRQSSQLDAVNVRESKRQKSNDSHDTIPGNQLMHTSRKLPKLETVEDYIHDFQTAAYGNCNEWLLCGSDLSPTQEEFVGKFASLTGSSVSRKWKKNVTHVIVPPDKHTCRSTNNVLLAILSGKWVLKFNWIEACFELKKSVPEEPYEISKISLGVCDCFNGPKKGRLGVRDKASRIFSGLNFYFCDQFNSIDRVYEDLIVAAGGTVLKKDDLKSSESNRAMFSSQLSYIVYNEDPPTSNSLHLEEIGRKRCDEVAALVANTGFKVIGHLWLLHTIASYNSADELAKGAI